MPGRTPPPEQRTASPQLARDGRSTPPQAQSIRDASNATENAYGDVSRTTPHNVDGATSTTRTNAPT